MLRDSGGVLWLPERDEVLEALVEAGSLFAADGKVSGTYYAAREGVLPDGGNGGRP